jgi:DNA-binding response OmpR family regulator
VDVVLIEDDGAIASSLESGLRASGMTVRHFAYGLEALQASTPDVYLVDVGLPDIDGFEVVRRIRERSDTPVIILTARGEEIDRVMGLEIGADDYVTKPFGLRELIARIRAVVRRSGGPESMERLVEVGALRIDVERRLVHVADSVVELTAKEFDLLTYLATRPGVVHRRTDIMEAVWDEHWYGPTKTLDAHIASLRKKLGHPEWIEAVRGVGFRLDVPQ